MGNRNYCRNRKFLQLNWKAESQHADKILLYEHMYLSQNIMRFQTRRLQSMSISLFCVNIIAFWLMRNKSYCLYYILMAVITPVFPFPFRVAVSLFQILFCFRLYFFFNNWIWATLGSIFCLLQNKELKVWGYRTVIF